MSALYDALTDLADARQDLIDELRAEDAAARREYQRLGHWCTVCLGRTGPGSPCYIPTDEEQTAEDPA